ncbi:ABC transporter ATP-binding protein [Lysinibacillus fusiformis]|uniref:ABC transporter ATP-binding protein n=1 Tax=Lysinibacillus fusiformis TaxID=28031 RepID=UPI00196834C2|nr:ABC transporter ATP-binding protein [Lysinibacillus fusiformis]QSB08731.1 ABC transporter ATP-binding protein [Lysinibacillus fusiformis]
MVDLKTAQKSKSIENVKNNEKKMIWKPFIKLIGAVRLPYLWIILSIFVSICMAQIILLFPHFTQKILSGDISNKTILIASIILLGQSLFVSLVEFVGSVTSSKISLRFRKFIWKRLLDLPIPFYDKNTPREMISRTTDDTTHLSSFFAKDIPTAISAIYSLVGSFIILFSYNWRLAVIEAIIIPLVVLAGIINGRFNYKWTNKVQINLAKLTGLLSELLWNIPLMKTFVKENREEKRGEEYIDKLVKTKFISTFINFVFQLITDLTNVIHTIIVIVIGIYLISQNIITLPIWIAFYMYATWLVGSVSGLMNVWTNLKTSQGAARRITEIYLELGEENHNLLPLPLDDADLKFENVSFKYSENTVLKDVKFIIPHGKVTAIVGPSGVGKSTIFNLIERFYKPSSGQIKFGDTPIEKYNLHDWRKAFVYVSQTPQIFSGTIRDNIIYGIDRDVSEDEIINSATKAYAMGFINTFENGLDTEVGEGGSKLSGGQKQRIAIARAFLRNPKYLLLDEATSSLDAEAESMVDKAIKELSAERTTIIITHRLSTIAEADQIIFLNQKIISGIGNHNSLLENNKFYRELVEIQQKTGIC